MITAIDSNILVDILSNDAAFADGSVRAVREARARGGLIACEVVWAEVAGWAPSPDEASASLARMGIDFVPMTSRTAVAAGASLVRYRRSGGPRERILPDFLIGAHAWLQADRLLTRDHGFYRRYFERLLVIDPRES